MYNPDYPQQSAPTDFLQHCFNPQNNNNGMTGYYPGMNNPFNGNFCMDTRRGVGMNNNNTNMFAPTGNGFNNPFAPNQNNNAVPESMVQPFSSYPPSAPTGNGFNNPFVNNAPQGVDTRRGIGNNPQVNPWANMQPTNPYTNMFAGSYYGQVPMNMSALYQNIPMGFNRKDQNWDNMYTCNQQVKAPDIDWYKAMHQNDVVAPCQGYGYCNQAQYPQQNAQASWYDLAKKNWR